MNDEIAVVRPFAKHIYDQEQSGDDRGAWGRAVYQRLRNHNKNHSTFARAKATPDFKAIAAVDAKHQAWGFSTCGLEGLISVDKRAFTTHRMSADINSQSDEIHVLTIPPQLEK